jgi:Ni/Fe-hydrogenase subunit HybB-like protein
MFPIPNQMDMWPNFRSPLLWDVFAVSVYGTVSALFWYVGLIPDLATMRDRAKTPIRKLAYGIFALGWRGSARQWHHYESAYLLLAALATPLVLSVHSVVSMDFAVSVLPGWHTTIFPPYFVAGAIFSGFAMVLTLMVICRKAFGLEHIITLRHFDYMAKIILVTGTMVGYAYATEFFTAWYSGNPYENLHVPEPRARAVRLGLLDHGRLQRDQPAGLLVQAGAHEHPDPVRAVDRHQHRHVVRAVRDHRDVAAP